ncbi:DUF2520 domain-containing protein [Rhodococcus sp. KBW08]|uniref:Rossmann-like and DUF2520 domain-containing protein n=1 Tax=Rhodococcus TaxID=1827 RepID=UPI000F59F8F3|nr:MULTISPECIES: DUF2520 domain-containing protein [Rhodococcus]MDI9956826.1 DUF2520 domain-containing protein [Rhodococcus sp. IEGM 1237]MDI9962634.1 DUF2520 domain-containing protein [Rhodococcus sp. IEGM 1251]MDV8125822.1 DUF2520 domain-containing protein [Rhodococcus sp. IEGM 1304]RQO44776.1 DUF2520 domain-containing protein [Rhodococcus sp. KBW08]UJC76796.1 DUF2520 domain-containing protein [Rhodococcus erythropolis]
MTSFGITNGPAPARLTVGIVSAGRVGTAVGAALERAGHVVSACSAVSSASVARAVKRLPDTEILPAADVAARSELLILAVPDDQLADLVRGLAATQAVKPGTLVAHTSGANGIAILAPLTELGALPLAIHPAMTFTGHDEDTARLSSACFGITAADDIGYAIAQSLVLEIGGEPVRVREENRALYHAALAHGSNHLVTLVVDAVEALRASLQGDELLGQQLVDGDPGGVAERVLQPLLSAALDNALRRGPSALTGPVARGDAAAVDTHLRVLTDLDPELAAGYRAMSLRSAQRVGAPTELFDILTETGGDRRE